MMEKKKKELTKRSNSTSRLSGLFKNIIGKKSKRVVIVLVDDDEKNIREISSMIRAIQPEIEVLSAQDGIDGLVLLKSNAEDVRWCLCDMVMPGLSGIELLNRARVDPALKHVTFALMTEFSAGKETNSSRKTLSHFQVSDDRGEPVSVMIKPLHAVLIEEMLKSVPLPGVSLVRKHSESTLLNAGMEADPDWARTRSRSDWAKRSEVPAIVAPTTPDNQSPRSSSRTTSPGAEGSLSPRGAGPSTTARRTGLPSSLEGSPRRNSTSPRRGSGTLPRNALNGSGTELPKFVRRRSHTVSHDNRDELVMEMNDTSSSRTSSGSGRNSPALTRQASTERGNRSSGEGSSEMLRSASQHNIAGSNSEDQVPRSVSLYALDKEAALSPRVLRLRPTGASPSPRVSKKGSSKTKAQANNAASESEPHHVEEESKVEAGSKRWSMRHNQEGIVDESKGVNDIMFDSISSLDRDQVPRSVSMDMLNWDEVT